MIFGRKPTEKSVFTQFGHTYYNYEADNKGGTKMHEEPLTVSVSTEENPSLTPGELKALVARIRQAFDRPLPEP